LLLARNANALLRDDSGKTPAHLAAKYGYDSVIKLLLDRDHNVINLQDNHSQTVLHLAVLRYSTLLNGGTNEGEYIRYDDDEAEYIRYEERVLSEDERLAALSNSAKLIKMMCNHCSINFILKNNDGYTVLDLALAIEHDQHKIAEHLQEKRLLWRESLVHNAQEFIHQDDKNVSYKLPSLVTDKIFRYLDDYTLALFQEGANEEANNPTVMGDVPNL
ncbi:ankyrin repeat family protein, partial [Orientia tsutsugamushi str. UT76]